MSANGDILCHRSLSLARDRAATLIRLCMRSDSTMAAFDRGYVAASLSIAELWHDADPLIVMSVRNECRFLLGDYLDGSLQ